MTVGPKPLTVVFTQVSWEKALGVFNARLATAPLEHDTKLRCQRDTIAAVYSDFAAKLPEARFPALFTRAMLEDGRTEGSQYPNLMIPRVWDQYII